MTPRIVFALRAGAVAVFAALTAYPASAQTPFTASYTVKWTGNENIGNLILNGANINNVYISALDFNPITPAIAGQTRFDGYCLDLAETAAASPFSGTLNSMSSFVGGANNGVSKGGAVSWLYNTYSTQAKTSNRDSAALQLAIWEVLYDWTGSTFTAGGLQTTGGINLTGGSFQFDSVRTSGAKSDIINRANGFLTSWAGNTNANATWLEPNNTSRQPFVGPGAGLSTNVANTIPEPGTVALLATGFGMTGLAMVRRRK